MTGGFLDGNIFRGLAFRILVFLSLALLPFGLISVVQTREIARQAVTNAELSLLGLSEQASGVKRGFIQEAFGAGEALSSIVRLFGQNTEACVSFLRNYRDVSEIYEIVGHISESGIMTCSSAGGTYDFSAYPDFDRALSARKPIVIRSQNGPIMTRPALVVLDPVFAGGEFAGFMLLSVRVDLLVERADQIGDRSPTDLVTFNAFGEILTSDRPRIVAEADLPRDRSLQALVGREKAFVFDGVNTRDQDRVYALTPIVPNVVYAMSVWRQEDVADRAGPTGALNVYLPVIMWLASLIVAFWSINRLAIRYIRKLGRQMRLFAYNRAMPRTTMGQNAPREFIEIQKVFMSMADSILKDEASLEGSLREKNILLKEVHHRVKNNLQLISSIMNLQIRRAPTEDARRVLRRLQDRILSLATVHKNLYQSQGLDRVEADKLVKEIVGQLLVVGLPAGSAVQVEQSYEPVLLDTDDAAPLTLLVSEAVTNAMKYIGSPTANRPARLEILMKNNGDDTAQFEISNTIGDASGVDGTGLGAQLINAFARQLNAEIESSSDAGIYKLKLAFPLPKQRKQILDY